MEPYLSLPAVKALAKRASSVLNTTGLSVNDVLMAALAGALRKYQLQKVGPTATSLQAHHTTQAVVWVSLRPMDLNAPVEWGCNLGVVYIQLPLHLADPLERLTHIHAQIEKLKTSPEPLVSNWLMSLFGFLPPCIGRPLWYSAAYKVSVSVSNVPGSPHARVFDGCPIDEFLFFVAPNRNLGNFVCIMSYADRVSFGYASDARLVPEPHALTSLFADDMDQLEAALAAADGLGLAGTTVAAAAAAAAAPGAGARRTSMTTPRRSRAAAKQ